MSQRESLDPDRLAPEAANPVVTSIMRHDVVFCLPSMPIDAVAKLMADNDLEEIPVILDKRCIGYVTATDVLSKVVTGDVVLVGSDVATRPPTTNVLARDLLRQPVLFVDEQQLCNEVIAIMQERQRTVALVMHEDETPIGMVTPREIVGHLAATLLPQEAVHGNA